MGKPTGFLEYERETARVSFHLRNVFRILTNSISL